MRALDLRVSKWLAQCHTTSIGQGSGQIHLGLEPDYLLLIPLSPHSFGWWCHFSEPQFPQLPPGMKSATCWRGWRMQWDDVREAPTQDHARSMGKRITFFTKKTQATGQSQITQQGCGCHWATAGTGLLPFLGPEPDSDNEGFLQSSQRRGQCPDSY